MKVSIPVHSLAVHTAGLRIQLVVGLVQQRSPRQHRRPAYSGACTKRRV